MSILSNQKIKAAILVKQNSPLIIDEIELPEKLNYGQILVKICYSSICGAQLNEINGTKGPDKFLPHLLGHEGSGIVQKCGEGVTKVKEGDHVVLHWRKGEGINSATPKYKWNNQAVNAGWVTTFNEYAVVSENRVTPISKDFDLKMAPLYGCAITTAFGIICNDAKLKAGESTAVFGAGGVGVAVILAASLASAYPIIAIDINDIKLEQAKRFGATHTINSANEDVRKKIVELLPEGVDAVIDTTGIKSIKELAYELTNKEGITVFVGVSKAGENIYIDTTPLHFNKKITGSHGGDANPTYDIPRLMRLEKSGKFDSNQMITHVISLDEINEGIELVKQSKCCRVMIDFNKK